MQRTFQLNTSKLFLTYPQCKLDAEYILEQLKHRVTPQYVANYVVAREHHANGDDHRHVYLELSGAFRTRDAKCFDIQGHHGNYQGCRSAKNVLRYCTKDDNYISNMDIATLLSKPSTRKKVGEQLVNGEKTPWEAVQEHPELIFGYKKLKVDFETFLVDSKKPIETNGCRGIWIWGPPGAGKSTHARRLGDQYGGGLYLKQQSKWWDGYRGEENVLLDDADSDCLSHHMKIWADKWPCYGEVKNSMVPLMHKKFIVTSNYPIKVLYKEKGEVIIQAIERRFHTIHMPLINSGT